jgi:hypothetical protein
MESYGSIRNIPVEGNRRRRDIQALQIEPGACLEPVHNRSLYFIFVLNAGTATRK